MNTGKLTKLGIVGLVLLAGGLALALYAHQNIVDFQTTIGQISRALSEERQNEYQWYTTLRIIGIVSAVIGGVLTVADIAGD